MVATWLCTRFAMASRKFPLARGCVTRALKARNEIRNHLRQFVVCAIRKEVHSRPLMTAVGHTSCVLFGFLRRAFRTMRRCVPSSASTEFPRRRGKCAAISATVKGLAFAAVNRGAHMCFIPYALAAMVASWTLGRAKGERLSIGRLARSTQNSLAAVPPQSRLSVDLKKLF